MRDKGLPKRLPVGTKMILAGEDGKAGAAFVFDGARWDPTEVAAEKPKRKRKPKPKPITPVGIASDG